MDYEKLREDAIEACEENPEFVWKSRIVNAVDRKIATIRSINHTFGIKDTSKIAKLNKSIANLERWIDSCIEEEMEAIKEDNMDPYTLRGLRRSDF